MTLEKYIVYACRESDGITTRITKAIEEEGPGDALMEFCNLLGMSPQVLERPERLGTYSWDIFVCRVTDAQFMNAYKKFNCDPIRQDFRSGRRYLR